MGKQRLKLHVISHIRWDREGVQTFQESRLKLVRFLDDLLEIFAGQPRFDSFVLSGQSILIEDYLEVRPEHRDTITRLVQNGRLHIGPWYVLPDEFLVSPESLIRNLLLGRQTAMQFGAQPETGYLYGESGHIGQMPQILHDFGLEGIVMVCHADDTPLEQWWAAPQSNRVLLARLWERNTQMLPLSAGPAEFRTVLMQTKNKLRGRAQSSELAFVHGDNDHLDTVIEQVDEAQRSLRGIQVVHGDLPGYMAAVKEADNRLPAVTGEIHPSLHGGLATGSLGTRIWVKQRNHVVQTLLEHWVEPFSAWASLVSNAPNTPDKSSTWLQSPERLAAFAWRTLLPNHSHASMLGHATDQVHREMHVRFEQAEQIGAELAQQSLCYLTQQIDTNSLQVANQLGSVVVFNGTGQSHTDLVAVNIPITPGLEYVEIADDTGTQLPIEVIQPREENGNSGANTHYQVRFVAQDVPTYGYRSYRLYPGTGALPQVQIDGELMIENEYLGISVEPLDGTLMLFDKRTGRSFGGLNHYIDGGDCGDAAEYRSPAKDTLIDIATNTPLYVERRISNVRQELSFLQIYRLPQRLTPQRDARLPLTAQFVPISITTTLRLVSGVPRVDVEATIFNGALDHRLRVHFPTGTSAQKALLDGHFEISSRPIVDSIGYPQRSFATVLGIDTGITIANRGLPGVSFLTSEEGTEIVLTLLRSIGWLRRDVGGSEPGNEPPISTPEAQCLGEYQFAYSLIPHDQDPLPAWQQAWAFQVPLRGQVTDLHSGPLPAAGSLATVDNPAFVLSAVKMAESGEGLVVRGYSISDSTEQVTLTPGVATTRAEFIRIDETPTGLMLDPNEAGRYQFEVHPTEIVTLLLYPPTPR